MSVDLEHKDTPNQREYTVGGKALTAVREDPFGFWSLKTEEGALPKALSGQYTSTIEVEKALKNYEAQKEQEAAKAKATPAIKPKEAVA